MDQWCILRTSGPRTLALAKALNAAGIHAWTPTKTTRRRPIAGRAPRREVDAPIVPTFVFAPAGNLPALVAALVDPANRLPAFSIFQSAGRAPTIGEHSLSGLRLAEREAAEILQAIRDAESREEARQARAAMLRTQAARRKAMRATGKALAPGAVVEINQAALAGMTGKVVSSTDRETKVDFGRSLAWTVETWQVLPIALRTSPLAVSSAA